MKKSALVLAAGLGLVPLAAVTPEVGAANLVVGSLNRTGAGSLAAVAALAATNGTADTITFADGLTGTIILDSGITLDAGDSIVGPGATVLTVSGDDLIQPVSFSAAGTISISGLAFSNGTAVNGGCLSSTDTDLVLVDVQFLSCAASGDGGAVHVSGGSLTGDHLYLAGNTAGDEGGAIWERDGAVSLSTSTLANNTAGTNGGGLMAYSAPTLTRVMVLSNQASIGYGGGIYVADGVGMAMRRCTVNANIARNDGGGLYVGNMLSNGSGLIASSVFEGNTAGQNPGSGLGGGIALDLADDAVAVGSFTVVNTTVTGNHADFYGGIVAMTGLVVEVAFAFDTIVDNIGADPSGQQLGVFMPAMVTHSVVAGDGDDLDASVSVNVERSLIGDQSVTYVGGAFALDAWTSAHIGDAHGLGALSDNGGPTYTMKPSAASVLVNGGATSLVGAPLYDARGVARKQAGRFDIGAVELQAPSAPRNITAGARVDAVRVGWSVPSSRGDSPILGYRVYRRLSDGSWSRVGTVGAAVRSFVVSGLVTGRLYRFKVVAVNSAGAGPASATVAARAG